MREFREVRKRLGDDQDAAAPYIGYARTLLGQLKNEMSFNGLKQLTRRRFVQHPCGLVEIIVQSVFGQDTIHIRVPRCPQPAPLPEKDEIGQKVQLVYIAGHCAYPFAESSADGVNVQYNDWVYNTEVFKNSNVEVLGRGWFGIEYAHYAANTNYSCSLNDCTYDSYAKPAWAFVPLDVEKELYGANPSYLVGRYWWTSYYEELPQHERITKAVVHDKIMRHYYFESWADTGWDELWDWKTQNPMQGFVELLRNIPWDKDPSIKKVVIWPTTGYYGYHDGAMSFEGVRPWECNAGVVLEEYRGVTGTIQGIIDQINALGVSVIVISAAYGATTARGSHGGGGLDALPDIAKLTGGLNTMIECPSIYSGDYGCSTIQWVNYSSVKDCSMNYTDDAWKQWLDETVGAYLKGLGASPVART